MGYVEFGESVRSPISVCCQAKSAKFEMQAHYIGTHLVPFAPKNYCQRQIMVGNTGKDM
jgi:hypothetical protein